MKKKLSLRKIKIADLSPEQSSQIVGGDFDTPTINDNCDFGSAGTTCVNTIQNTFCICNPRDWCGYNHETDCWGPAITAQG